MDSRREGIKIIDVGREMLDVGRKVNTSILEILFNEKSSINLILK